MLDLRKKNESKPKTANNTNDQYRDNYEKLKKTYKNEPTKNDVEDLSKIKNEIFMLESSIKVLEQEINNLIQRKGNPGSPANINDLIESKKNDLSLKQTQLSIVKGKINPSEIKSKSDVAKVIKNSDSKKEMTDYEKIHCQNTYKKLKKAYKKGPAGERLINVINGSKPKWRKIKNYTAEEMDFLLRIAAGDTKLQKSNSRYASANQTREEKKLSIWNEYVHSLDKKSYLEYEMDEEERLGR